MRDYRRLKAGTLRALYTARHPTQAELEAGIASGAFVPDTRVSALPSPRPDQQLNQEVETVERILGRALALAEFDLNSSENEVARLQRELAQEREQRTTIEDQLSATRARRAVRWSDAIARRLRRQSS
jgi:hypothetical protein